MGNRVRRSMSLSGSGRQEVMEHVLSGKLNPTILLAVDTCILPVDTLEHVWPWGFFGCCGSVIWNMPTDNLWDLTWCTDHFHLLLKTFLFTEYYVYSVHFGSRAAINKLSSQDWTLDTTVFEVFPWRNDVRCHKTWTLPHRCQPLDVSQQAQAE